MINNNYSNNKIVNLEDMEEDKKYNLILKLRTTDIIMENLKPSEVSQEINALNINCAILKYPFNHFITEYSTELKSKNL